MILQNNGEPTRPAPWVIVASSPAGVVTKTVPTSTISTREKMRITSLTTGPSSSPTISGRLAPFFLNEIIPEK